MCYDSSGSLTPRIVWSIIIEVIVFIITVGLAMVDSHEWPGIFFWITMTSVVILNSKHLANNQKWNAFAFYCIAFWMCVMWIVVILFFSCGRNLSKFRIRYGCKASRQIYGRCRVGFEYKWNIYISHIDPQFIFCIKSTNSSHLLFHCSHVCVAGLFRHIFCVATECLYWILFLECFFFSFHFNFKPFIIELHNHMLVEILSISWADEWKRDRKSSKVGRRNNRSSAILDDIQTGVPTIV